MKYRLTFTLLLLLAVVCETHAGNKLIRFGEIEPTDAPVISIIELIATPKKYEGREVQIRGWVQIQDEEQAVYLSAEDGKYGIAANAIWFEPGAKLKVKDDELLILNRKWVRMKGVFRSQPTGHMGRFKGTLDDVSLIEELKPRWR